MTEAQPTRGPDRKPRVIGVRNDVVRYMREHPDKRLLVEDIARALRLEPRQVKGAVNNAIRYDHEPIEIIRSGNIWIYHTKSEPTPEPEAKKADPTAMLFEIITVRDGYAVGINDGDGELYKIIKI